MQRALAGSGVRAPIRADAQPVFASLSSFPIDQEKVIRVWLRNGSTKGWGKARHYGILKVMYTTMMRQEVPWRWQERSHIEPAGTTRTRMAMS
ncbi:hypothetical protein WJ0W_004748 [Paenibacillus melissococcoides]|uniref:Uncharacterized protein n=1 Tax=Paenibacillus melissococcoides TaxID=2912268 RepID=A0ABM9G7B4_9BACL|nr:MULTISPECIES: hypothetical protein [Paenibacillus]MEB9893846.1 hypothetical protein [Bacillus cereus]CAH8247513.1 hypothetical protein WJ0W_004748 [Paenibacillus melissococcoides]CAH8705211.1 hypothetical protein HTL2_000832 [Paenibacillus melissococcoides]CAH8714623.1 hypothetical protein WDD9_003952 [Paenibacillus melissococcoides]